MAPTGTTLQERGLFDLSIQGSLYFHMEFATPANGKSFLDGLRSLSGYRNLAFSAKRNGKVADLGLGRKTLRMNGFSSWLSQHERGVEDIVARGGDDFVSWQSPEANAEASKRYPHPFQGASIRVTGTAFDSNEFIRLVSALATKELGVELDDIEAAHVLSDLPKADTLFQPKTLLGISPE